MPLKGKTALVTGASAHQVAVVVDHRLVEGELQPLPEEELQRINTLVREAVGFSAVETVVATGPKRKILANSQLPIEFGAPWGDNMMTGTVGLLEALRRRKGLEPISFI